MSQRNGNGYPKLDLKLNLSPPPPRRNPVINESLSQSPTATSPESSSVSSEIFNNHANSTTETTSMLLVGCPNCLLYVMLSEEDPKCPKCKSSVLLNVSQDNKNNSTKRTTNKNY